MAVDKLVDSAQLDTDLTAVADAIRTKGGTSASLTFPNGFVDAIDAIETGGGGGDPRYGLIAEINITSRVSEVRYDLPDLVLADHVLWVEYVNITLSESDWLYATAVNKDGNIKGVGNYSAQSTSISSLIQTILFAEAQTVSTVSFSGIVSGTMNTTGQGRFNTRLVNNVVNQFAASPYGNTTQITGGTIRLYGRIA